jgi:nitroreductase
MTLARDRYSCRSFNDTKVEQEKLDKILQAGFYAPTAVNLQPQRVLVLRSEQAIEKLRKCTPCHYNCSTALIVSYDKTVSFKRSFDDKDSGDIDASIVTTHMMLQAYELGVCSTWLLFFKPDEVKKEFNLPENYEPSAILVLGYPADDAQINEKHYKCADEQTLVQYDTY